MGQYAAYVDVFPSNTNFGFSYIISMNYLLENSMFSEIVQSLSAKLLSSKISNTNLNKNFVVVSSCNSSVYMELIRVKVCAERG